MCVRSGLDYQLFPPADADYFTIPLEVDKGSGLWKIPARNKAQGSGNRVSGLWPGAGGVYYVYGESWRPGAIWKLTDS